MKTAARLDLAADWLQRLQTGDHDEALIAEWTDWCQDDPKNLEAFERVEAVWNTLDTPQVRSLLKPRADRAFRYALPLVAGLALVVTTALWLNHRSGSTLATDIAAHRSQVLADGSRIDLGGRTRVLTDYTDMQRRIVVEAGEAFFEVAKDSGRPFVVQSGSVRITAIGTAFAVRRSGSRTQVTVTEGRVTVSPQPRILTAGEQVTLDDAGHSLKLTHVDPQTAVAWRHGILKFVDEPLRSVIEDVNRYSPRQIRIQDPALGELLYSGTIYRDRIEDWLQALEEIFPVQVARDGAGISLKGPPVSNPRS